jgi:hypothetical protein
VTWSGVVVPTVRPPAFSHAVWSTLQTGEALRSAPSSFWIAYPIGTGSYV